MSKVDLTLITRFLDTHCKYKNHYCDGKHIPYIHNDVDAARSPDKEPCEHFINGKCRHKYNPRLKWTSFEDAQAISLYKRGYTYKQISEQVGRSEIAIKKRLSRLDIWGNKQKKLQTM